MEGWLYKPEVSFSQKRSQRVLFCYWQYCEGVLFGFQGCIDQGFDVFDCVDIISMMNSFSVGGQFERTAFCLV